MIVGTGSKGQNEIHQSNNEIVTSYRKLKDMANRQGNTEKEFVIKKN